MTTARQNFIARAGVIHGELDARRLAHLAAQAAANHFPEIGEKVCINSSTMPKLYYPAPSRHPGRTPRKVRDADTRDEFADAVTAAQSLDLTIYSIRQCCARREKGFDARAGKKRLEWVG